MVMGCFKERGMGLGRKVVRWQMQSDTVKNSVRWLDLAKEPRYEAGVWVYRWWQVRVVCLYSPKLGKQTPPDLVLAILPVN